MRDIQRRRLVEEAFMQINSSDLNNAQFTWYKKLKKEKLQDLHDDRREEFGQHYRLNSKEIQDIEKEALKETVRYFQKEKPESIKPGRARRKPKNGKSNQDKVIEKSAKDVAFRENKGKEKEEMGDDLESLDLPPVADIELCEPEGPSVSSKEAVSIETTKETAARSAEDFIANIRELTASIRVEENLTKGRENEFFPILEKWRTIMNGNQKSNGVMHNMIETQFVKDDAEVLYNSVVAVAKYSPDFIGMVQAADHKAKEIAKFVTSSKKGWKAIHEKLDQTRVAFKPRNVSGDFEKIGESISKKTSSQKPEEIKEKEAAVRRLKECKRNWEENYRISHFCNLFLRAAEDRLENQKSIADSKLSYDCVQRFVAIDHTEKSGDEHILSINNKQSVIEAQKKFIRHVLAVRESLEVLLTTVQQLDSQYHDIFKTYYDLIQSEYDTLKQKYESNKALVQAAIKELDEVIQEETTPPCQEYDIHNASYMAGDEDVRIIQTGNEERELRREAASTQKIILEAFQEQMKKRWDRDEWTSWSKGLKQLFEKLTGEMNRLKSK